HRDHRGLVHLVADDDALTGLCPGPRRRFDGLAHAPAPLPFSFFTVSRRARSLRAAISSCGLSRRRALRFIVRRATRSRSSPSFLASSVEPSLRNSLGCMLCFLSHAETC